MSEGKEMGFLDHLEELRWHLVRSFAAILILTIVVFLSKDFVFGNIILSPTKPDFWTFRMLCKAGSFFNTQALCIESFNFTLQSRKMMGQFYMHFSSSFVIGLIVAFPYFFWEIWRFISPGMYSSERKHTGGTVFFVSLLFMLGVLFGYFIILPISINFFSGYVLDPSIENQFDITNYVSTMITIVLAGGIMFQLPVLAYFLSKFGLITPSFLQSKKKHAIILILIIAAILTPPDVVSQVLLAIPLIILYEISIIISKNVHKKRLKEIGFNEDEIDNN